MRVVKLPRTMLRTSTSLRSQSVVLVTTAALVLLTAHVPLYAGYTRYAAANALRRFEDQTSLAERGILRAQADIEHLAAATAQSENLQRFLAATDHYGRFTLLKGVKIPPVERLK